ncbi:TnsD family transposase [Heyndrickxia sporothermodurans]|uniref:TnsD family transposase n=1 Tax=Heyndrickxia sporothermodurans TaxID=46224 RepID=UPI002E1EE550|nr:TnsD family transposase [Heyndrickxia sporothermodurans]
MLFFPPAYPDELLFSICSRYFIRSGNISYKSTLDDLFSNRSLTTSIILPSGIRSLVKNLPPYSNIDELQLIYRHTLYLFYSAFLPPDRAKDIYETMCSSDGKGIHGKSGVLASTIPQNKYLRFCRDCMTEDKKKYGEYYWHRSHQLSGIQCCLTHYRPLYDSSIKVVGSNKHRFQIPTLDNCSANKSVLNGVSKKTLKDYMDLCRKIAGNLYQLMDQPFKPRKIEEFHQIYQSKLIGLNLAYYTGQVKQKEWRDYFSSIYSQELLQLCSSQLNGEQDWLSLIVQKNRKTFHPIRHLLVLAALEMEIAEMFENSVVKPFGNPNWPCLNTACNHYKVPVIDKVVVTLSEKTKEPIGTFTCPVCEFSYTRSGPDKDEEDKFRKTRVKAYGHVWMEKLQEYSKLDIGLRELSRKMGADPNTIKRYLDHEKEGNPAKASAHSEADRKKWLSLQSQNPNKNVKQLRQEEKALYMRLYRNDREWMKKNSPKTKRVAPPDRIDWAKRDEEMLTGVSKVVEELLNSEEKPIRVTIGKVGYLIGERALLEKKLDKMPKTKSYLQEKVETVEQFQERRILYTIKECKRKGEELVPWKILRSAGIKNHSNWVQKVINLIEE